MALDIFQASDKSSFVQIREDRIPVSTGKMIKIKPSDLGQTSIRETANVFFFLARIRQWRGSGRIAGNELFLTLALA